MRLWEVGRCRRGGEGRRLLSVLRLATWGDGEVELEGREGFCVWLRHLSGLAAGDVGERKGASPSMRCEILGRQRVRRSALRSFGRSGASSLVQRFVVGRCRQGKWSGKGRLWLVESRFGFVVGWHRGGVGVFVHYTTWGLRWRRSAVGRAVGF